VNKGLARASALAAARVARAYRAARRGDRTAALGHLAGAKGGVAEALRRALT